MPGPQQGRRTSSRLLGNLYRGHREKNINGLCDKICTKFGRELRTKHTTNAGRGLRMCAADKARVPVIPSHRELVQRGLIQPMPSAVALGPATHAEAGNGLIAIAPIQTGDFFASYGGRLFHASDGHPGGDYVIGLGEGLPWVVDGDPKKYPQRGHLAMFVNGTGFGLYKNDRPNAMLVHFAPDEHTREDGTPLYGIGVEAIRDIAVGEEILVDYGRQYNRDWEKRHSARGPTQHSE